MSIEQIKQRLVGGWVSIAPELRPSVQKNTDGSAKPFHLRREFSYSADDRFVLTVVNYADAYGSVPLARILIKGHMHWRGPHPIAEGAQQVDFVADEAYEITPLHPGFADLLNQIAAVGYVHWQPEQTQSIFGKDFALFGLVAGSHFKEYDLVHLADDLLFWGARHVDGRGFDSDANRPTNLQIPLVRR